MGKNLNFLCPQNHNDRKNAPFIPTYRKKKKMKKKVRLNPQQQNA